MAYLVTDFATWPTVMILEVFFVAIPAEIRGLHVDVNISDSLVLLFITC